MRQKAHLYEDSGVNTPNPLNYIFKSRKFTPQHKDLIQFENDLLELIKSVKLKRVKNMFSYQLSQGISSIKKSKIVSYLHKKLGLFMKQIIAPAAKY